MAERDLVAAERLRPAVQVSPAHARAEVTGLFPGALGGGKHVGLKDVDGDGQPRGVLLHGAAGRLAVAGIHHEKGQLEGNLAVPLQQLHQLGEQHRILAAGDAHGDAVARFDQLVALDGGDERVPQLLAKALDEAALDQLMGRERARHATSSFESARGQASTVR